MGYQVCLVCGRNLVQKPGGTRKDGTTWKPFMGCEVWDDDHKKAQEEYKARKATIKSSPKPLIEPPVTEHKEIGATLIMEELIALNKRFDSLALFSVEVKLLLVEIKKLLEKK